MPYRLIEFDGVPLPLAMPEDDLSTGTVETSLLDSIGGVYNYFGSTQRLPRRHQFPHKGKYVGEVAIRVTSDGDIRVTSDGDMRVTAPSTIADLQGKTDDLKAKIGMWGRLWRERMADGLLTWKTCRLLHVKHVETVVQANVISEVESTFETDMAGWRDEDITTSLVSATNGVPIPLLVSNSGLMTVEDAILRVARTSGTITAVQVTGAGIDIIWAGTIGAGQTLTIDCGRQTVLRGTSDQYSGLTLNLGHTVNGWLPLVQGANILTVTITGGNANVSMEHYNQWP